MIQPLVLNRFWYRRILEAVILVSLVIVGLFFWSFLGGSGSLIAELAVSVPAAICAGVALLVSFLFYLWVPSKQLFTTAFVSFLLLAALAGILVMSTGETHSPFIALWMIVAIFAAVFGIWGMGSIGLALVAYVVMSYLSQTLTTGVESVVLFSGVVPLLIGFFIWHTDKGAGDENDHAYRALATELSQVSGKSDVVINAIADGVIAIDSQGRIELINPAAQSIIGWGKQDALKLDYKSVLKLIDAKGSVLTEANDPIAGVLRDNKAIRTDNLTLVTVSEKNLFVSLVISPVGQIGSGVIIVFRDITREKAEEREQAEFISTASHEMRTPVASIEGYLGLTLNQNTAQIDDRARDFIGKAHESAQHLGRLFQDLLDVSKADDGRMQNDPKVIDVVDFVADVVESQRPKSNEKGLRLLYKPRPDGANDLRQERSEMRVNPIFYIEADTDHLREVTDNLVENAIKYTLSGDVIVDVVGDNEHVTISIQDSGIGIPPEDIGHLFQKFYRVDSTQTREIGGTGLGLYLCRRLVETMNGRIWVESEFKRGSTFNVELPRLATDEATRRIEQAASELEESQTAPTIGPAQIGPSSAPIELLVQIPPQPQVAPTPVPQQPVSTQQLQPQVMQPMTSTAPPSLQQITPTPLPQPTASLPQPQPAPARSIADIEQNKDQYIRSTRVAPISIPVRNDSEQNT